MGISFKTCEWPGNDLLMVRYHDQEWGVPVQNERKIFEFLVLESAQAGLSWRTILYKREGYRKLFADFDPKKVARFDKRQVETRLKDPAIIRNRLKIEATINNAKRFLEVQKSSEVFRNICGDLWAENPSMVNAEVSKIFRL